LTVGDDFGKGTATSVVFTLPPGIDHISFKRSGGADGNSGFYLRRSSDGHVLCSSEQGRDTNVFFDDSCDGLRGFGGVNVFIEIKDSQSSAWGKVLVDDIRLRSEEAGASSPVVRVLERNGSGHLRATTDGIMTVLWVVAGLLCASGATALGVVLYRTALQQVGAEYMAVLSAQRSLCLRSEAGGENQHQFRVKPPCFSDDAAIDPHDEFVQLHSQRSQSSAGFLSLGAAATPRGSSRMASSRDARSSNLTPLSARSSGGQLGLERQSSEFLTMPLP
jgi:hypothetical protein